MNDFVVECLLLNGWTEDRNSDTASIIALLKVEDWKLFDSGLKFISSFNGLPEFDPKVIKHPRFGYRINPFKFDAEYGVYSRENAIKLEKSIGKRLMPVGIQDLFNIYIAHDSSMYQMDADLDCILLGSDFPESMNNLFEGRFNNQFSIE